MKKFLALILAIVMVFALAACGSGKTETPKEETPEEVSSEEPVKEWIPEKEITIVVGAKAGGGIDIMCRTMATAMSEYLGVPIVIENMPGSSLAVAAEYVMSQPADGYTIFGCSSSICCYSTTENSDITYKDLGIMCMPFSTMNPAIIVGADSGIETMEDFLTYIKENDTIASHSGVGSGWHIAEALLMSDLGASDKVSYLPFNSGVDVTLATARGEANWTACGVYQESGESIKSGLVKPLAVFNAKDYELDGYGTVPSILKYVPSIEAYIDVIGGWRGIGYSLEMPEEIVAKLQAACEYAMNSADVKELLANNGVANDPIYYGQEAQDLYEKSSRIYSWLMYDLGDGTRSPDVIGVERWS